MKHSRTTSRIAVATMVIAAASMLAEARGPKGPAEAGGPKGPSIVDVALDLNSDTNSPYAGQLDILVAALLAADPVVVGTLGGNGQHTVFAPIDAAFMALGLDEAAVEGLDKDLLTDVLLYHVAHGRRYAEDVLESSRIRMLKGGFVFQDDGILTDNLGLESEIVVTDVEAANGIIHAINGVLLPVDP